MQKQDKMYELYAKIREDLVKKIYENNISLEKLASDMNTNEEELINYLKLDEADYLIYEDIYNKISK